MERETVRRRGAAQVAALLEIRGVHVLVDHLCRTVAGQRDGQCDDQCDDECDDQCGRSDDGDHGAVLSRLK